jgi:hypothetical protein
LTVKLIKNHPLIEYHTIDKLKKQALGGACFRKY